MQELRKLEEMDKRNSEIQSLKDEINRKISNTLLNY